MHIAAILGSRNENGRTAEAAGAFADGTSSKGAIVDTFFLPSMSLESCRQCDADGWGICRREGMCVIDDDFQRLVDALRSADGALFATPVYYGDLSESMKRFTDRLRRTSAPVISSTGNNVNHKPVIGICNAGGGGGGSYSCAVNLQRVLATCGFEVIDIVSVRRQNMEIKRKTLRMLGEWFPGYVTSGEWERVIPRPK